jgi:SAM-dependent methyltransferase
MMQSTDQEKRHSFDRIIQGREKIIIEIGCGDNKKVPGSIGIDRVALPGVDLVHDLEKGLSFIPDNSVDEVSSSHVLEHVSEFEFLMQEVHRILKKGGIHKVTVPHFSNPHYYSDFTHKRFFGLYTFEYFCKISDQQLNRKVHDFYVTFHFQVTHRQFNFKKNFSPRNVFNILIASPLFNASNYMKELYEDKFTYMFPCREMYYEMTPVKD